MAGSLAMVASEKADDPMAATSYQWQVQFARFFAYPSLSSTCQVLIPLPHNRRSRPTRGTWISTSSSTASLQIIKGPSSSDAILTVCFRGKILEEHYISKLNFSWPQVSCVSTLPARGSRAVFVTFKDSASEIQKFALQFLTFYEAEAFVNTLKENSKNLREVEPLRSDFGSEISSQSELFSSNRVDNRACEKSKDLTPICTYAPQMPLSLNEVEQPSFSQETINNHKVDGASSALPPSFTSLITNCFSETKQVQTTVTGEDDLKSQIVKYMGDSSFQDMLLKVERIINEMGGDFVL